MREAGVTKRIATLAALVVLTAVLPGCAAAQAPGATPRQMMQTLGDWGRALHPDWWVKTLADSIGISPEGGAGLYHDRIVIADTRYPNEAAWIQAHGGTLIHLLRAQAEPVRAHSSEQHAADLGAQITLVNNGEDLDGLHQMIDGAMASLGISMRHQGDVA